MHLMSERLPGILVSGLVVGAGSRGFRIGYIVAVVLIFAIGVLIGRLFGG